MASVEKSIKVKQPVSTVYNQWTQFEEFPKFMKGVKQVQQLDETHLKWQAEIGFKDKEWTAEIDEQLPDQCISWHSTTGTKNDGIVRFKPVNSDETEVNLKVEYDPEGLVENVGDKVGFVTMRIQGDLERFKEFIESRGQETGAWRGTVI